MPSNLTDGTTDTLLTLSPWQEGEDRAEEGCDDGGAE